MRISKFALILALLALLVLPSAAEMDQEQDQAQQYETETDRNQALDDGDQMGQQALNATVQPGPRLRANLPVSADVFINGVFAMRIPASAGGLSPEQRADRIADRLNQAFASGLTWQDAQVQQRNGLWTVNIGDNLIATADINSARAFGTQTGQLASRWARQSVIAMGGQPQMIAQQLMPVTVAVAGSQQELGANWSVSPVRSLPLINVADGQQVGTIAVAGPQNQVNRANSVALYAYSADGANVWSFVPTSSTSVSDVTVPRTAGVGVVRVSSDLLSMGGTMVTGDDAVTSYNEMSASQWNSLVNQRFSGWSVMQTGSTKVVPLYSLDTNQVIGAAQIVGPADAIARTQTVVATQSNGSIAFSGTTSSWSAISARPAAQNNVVVSALITFTGGEVTGLPDSMNMNGTADQQP